MNDYDEIDPKLKYRFAKDFVPKADFFLDQFFKNFKILADRLNKDFRSGSDEDRDTLECFKFKSIHNRIWESRKLKFQLVFQFQMGFMLEPRYIVTSTLSSEDRAVVTVKGIDFVSRGEFFEIINKNSLAYIEFVNLLNLVVETHGLLLSKDIFSLSEQRWQPG